MIARIPLATALCAAMLFLWLASRTIALAAGDETGAPSTNGPVLRLDYGANAITDASLSDFMYFIALISPEPVVPTSNPLTTQRARLSLFTRNDRSKTFRAACEFEFTGEGWQRNLIDHSASIQSHQRQLKAGKPLLHQLASINVEGPGKGNVTIEGSLSNGLPVVTLVRFRFNAHSMTSPVSIVVEDIHFTNGVTFATHQLVARVNALTFHRKPGAPAMDVSISSVKEKNAHDSFWQNLKGGIKGEALNLFIPPVPVARVGNDAMLDFGQALVSQSPTFTFPAATNLLASLPPL